MRTHSLDVVHFVLEKLKKLIGLVAMAFGFCLVAGHHYQRKVQAIPLKGHGYKSLSYFRKGKNEQQDWLADKPVALYAVWEAALDRAYHWLKCQLTYYQNSTKIFR